MEVIGLLGDHGLLATTFAVFVVGSIVPLAVSELYLLAIAAALPRTSIAPVVLVAAGAHMVGKLVLYWAARGAVRLPFSRPRANPGRSRVNLDGFRKRLERGGWRSDGFILLSAITGLPPFYVVGVVVAALGLRLKGFLLWGFAGRTVRFAVIMLCPELFLGIVR